MNIKNVGIIKTALKKFQTKSLFPWVGLYLLPKRGTGH